MSISVSPGKTTILSGKNLQFTATIKNASDVTSLWWVSAGKISDDGLFTAPIVNKDTNVIITAVSHADSNKQAAVTVVITPVSNTVAVQTGALPNAVAGIAYSQMLTASGGSSPYRWTLAAGALPQGLQLDGSKGSLTGTPNAAGSYSFSVTATDASQLSATRYLTLEVAAPTNPVAVVTSSLPNGTTGVAYRSTLAATGGQSPYRWALTSGTLPAGIQLDGASGTISGTTSTAGSYSFTATVTDAASYTASRQLSLVVDQAVDPLNLLTTSLPDATSGTNFEQALTASGGQTPYRWNVTGGALPAGIQLDNASGVIGGTTNSTGSFSFTVMVSDSGSRTASRRLSLTVNKAIATLAVLTTSLPDATAGANFQQGLAATGGQTPYSWTVSGGALPSGIQLDSSSGVISGTTNATGSFPFTVTVADSGSRTATRQLNLAVDKAVAPLAVVTTSLPDATTGTDYQQVLAATGGQTPYRWNVTAGTLPSGIQLTGSTGAISGTTGVAGSFSFTVTVTDTASRSATRQLSIVVDKALGILGASLPDATTGVSYQQTLVATGGQSPYQWSLTAGALPDGMQLNSSTGVISGTTSASGSFSFTATVTDAGSRTAARQVVLFVDKTLNTVTTSLPDATTGTNYQQTLAATGGQTPYRWSLSAGALPNGIQLSSSTGTLNGITNAAGSYSFTVTVTDAASRTATHQLSLVVDKAVSVGTTSLPDGTAGVSYQQTMSASGGQTPYQWNLTSGALPSGIQLGSSTGIISGTTNGAGSYSFTLTVTDAASRTATRQLTLVIDRALSVNTTSLPDATAGTSYQQTLAATGGQVPYRWSVTGGTLPAGFQLGTSSGAISGTTSAAGSFSFTVTVTDNGSRSATRQLALIVDNAVAPLVVTTASLPDATAGTNYQQALVGSGGQTPYRWSVSAGSLPLGIQLGGSSGSLGGTTNATGTFSFTIKITDAASRTATRQLALIVDKAIAPLAVLTTSLPDATAGNSYHQVLAATGGQTPYQWNVSNGSLPSGIQLDSSSGTVSGTTSNSGSFQFTVTVTDSGSRSASRQLALVSLADDNGAPVIPSRYFGLQSKATGGTYPTISFGSFRLWDQDIAWMTLNPSNGTYRWENIDGILGQLKTNGMTDISYTFGMVPHWASSVPADPSCDYYEPGNCDLPTDLRPDGSGTDQTFINFVQNLAQHVNDPAYLQTHAHIKYWEPWNEWYRDPVLSPYNQGCIAQQQCTFRGTYAQLVRMTEDLRCVITGSGNVNGAPCNRPAIDASAKILTPAAHGRTSFGPSVMENFLHCDSKPDPNSGCTTGDRGRQAVDILNFHFYSMETETPEEITDHMVNIKAGLHSADLAAMPVWGGEGGWGRNVSLPDPDMQQAFLVRYYVLGWSSGVSVMSWYEFENNAWGTLYAPQRRGSLTAPGHAYQQVYNWMTGNTMPQPCTGPTFPDQGVWTCNLSKPDGTQMQIVWDSSKTCNRGVCTTSLYSQNPIYSSYIRVDGTKVNLTTGSVAVGAKPILLIE